jgi:hypothetical protein
MSQKSKSRIQIAKKKKGFQDDAVVSAAMGREDCVSMELGP